MQIGRNIAPETRGVPLRCVWWHRATRSKRQKQELLEAMRRLYIRAGVLVDDRKYAAIHNGAGFRQMKL